MLDPQPQTEPVGTLRLQLAQRDALICRLFAEVRRLRRCVVTLEGERQLLEQYLQNIPELYREKLSARLQPVVAQLKQLQAENRRLQEDPRTRLVR